MENPKNIYSQLLEQRRTDLATREHRHQVLGYLQLSAAVCVLAVIGLALAHKLSIFWVFLPAAAFAVFFITHDRLLRVAEFRRRSIRYCESALDRLNGNWAGR